MKLKFESRKLNITAKITGIKYTPFLYRELNSYDFDEIERAMERK